MIDPCAHCEEMMQPFVDGELSDDERLEAEAHLATCDYCRKRYRFETELRHFVKTLVDEPMAPDLKAKLAMLRTPLQ